MRLAVDGDKCLRDSYILLSLNLFLVRTVNDHFYVRKYGKLLGVKESKQRNEGLVNEFCNILRILLL